jgi:hypothetical protein
MESHSINIPSWIKAADFGAHSLRAGFSDQASASGGGVPPAADCSSAETHWKSVESIGTLAAYNDHLARFSKCVFSTLAAERIEALKK